MLRRITSVLTLQSFREYLNRPTRRYDGWDGRNPEG